MPVTVEISNPAKLRRVRSILGAKSDNEAAELALEKVIEDHEPAETKPRSHDLPDEYWDDLFSERMLPNNAGSQAVIDERNESRF
ncbi:MAG TPA: hypothetical protein PKC89_09475 [Pyrinomonadaceae bacterium]|nr:hypothetical protein [Pyrinomonadaceae bacterium]